MAQAPATDVEILALDDAVSAALKEEKQAKNRYRNALNDLEAQKVVVTTRVQEVQTAQVNLKSAEEALDVGLKSRMP
jgi:ribosomal protein L5